MSGPSAIPTTRLVVIDPSEEPVSVAFSASSTASFRCHSAKGAFLAIPMCVLDSASRLGGTASVVELFVVVSVGEGSV